jgi:hypothetical protein
MQKVCYCNGMKISRSNMILESCGKCNKSPLPDIL